MILFGECFSVEGFTSNSLIGLLENITFQDRQIKFNAASNSFSYGKGELPSINSGMTLKIW